jgi:glycosyltransferase involved in cell wall biosynthesis
MSTAIPSRPDSLTIIVPTRNESENVEPLLSRLADSLSVPATVLFVDDSDDETPIHVRRAAAHGYPGLDVQLLHRPVAERRGGLGGAVLAGLGHTDSTWVCVMDGDLQHPPECVMKLLAAAVEQGVDLVVASRYVAGGRNEGLGGVRTLVSLGSTALAKVVFPGRLRGIHDPMSGFFLLRRASLTSAMTPRGFKILLEIAVRHPGLTRCEVPFIFVERSAGTSKTTIKEGLRYLRLLAEMRLSLSTQEHGSPSQDVAVELPAVATRVSGR